VKVEVMMTLMRRIKVSKVSESGSDDEVEMNESEQSE
jgi:hypothetical protein